MKLFKLLLVSLFCLSLVACGNPHEIKVNEGGGKVVYEGIDKYISSSEYQAEIKETIETMDKWGLTLEVKSEGDTLVYSYTYQSQVDLSDEAKNNILESIKSQSDVYNAIIDQISKDTTEGNPKVKIVYYNADGSVLVEHVFTK